MIRMMMIIADMGQTFGNICLYGYEMTRQGKLENKSSKSLISPSPIPSHVHRYLMGPSLYNVSQSLILCPSFPSTAPIFKLCIVVGPPDSR